MTRPNPSEYAPFYATYVDLVQAPLAEALQAQPGALARLVAGADPDAAYAPGKWTVRQVLLHTTDTERVFALRALWFARGGDPLPGFDENAWAATAGVSHRSVADLTEEARTVRASTLALLAGLGDGARLGVASGHAMSVRAAAFVIAGHTAHHMAVLRDRYGLG